MACTSLILSGGDYNYKNTGYVCVRHTHEL